MTRLTAGGGFDVEPAWSPDAKKIAFISGRTLGAGALRLIRAADGEPVELPIAISAKDKLFFHPTGERLLGCFQRDGGAYAVGWLELGTGKLGDELRPDAWGLRYSLSHDGKTIGLSTSQDIRGEQGGNNGPQCDLWTMPAAGRRPSSTTTTQAPW